MFMVNRHMDDIIREQPLSGRVIGIRASYSPRYDPDTGKRLECYFQNGNIDETRETIVIRARARIEEFGKGRQRIIVCKGAIAHRAAYEPIASRLIEVETPGSCAGDVRRFDYRSIRRPLFPLD